MTATTGITRRRLPLLVVQTMRPRQWIKNSFVLAGVLFSGRLDDADALGNAVLVTIAFCLASGASYLLNDTRDAETDRLNPRTATRPIARGDLPVNMAYAAAVVTLLAAVGLAMSVNAASAAVVAVFLGLQLGYSMGLKHVLFVDVMVIAALFVLRAFGGVMAVDAEISPWLLLVTGLLALFLALSKRRGEAVAIGGQSNPQRPVLDFYSVSLLDELIGVVTPSVVVVYALYTVLGARTDTMLATLPFVLYGIFRVLFLMHHRDRAGMTEEVDALVYRDAPLLVCVVLWGVACAVITLTA
ncbi:MAG TPA: decaprenyl-phosphate phosphoribosyltransferase [Baekduia sp.]|uniref:decaprenyl-phosphate phosphoribosyltransferase n=1 Tax=Baekduia sp. TaxID=2600305 RepID=UPI002CCED520|nr:decaprenyl-phosphate phosphoribosyltransferase [Baekduia sp.]HMJ36421.1 decaprenyl-phosphate phosphoribosyltransferase [Baekduia sp.]